MKGLGVSLTESVPTLFPDDWARVRRSDPVTSHRAADSNNVPVSHRLVMGLMESTRPWGLAQFEAENALSGYLSPSRVRSAFSELEQLGKVRRTDEFRMTPSGRRAQVWSVA